MMAGFGRAYVLASAALMTLLGAVLLWMVLAGDLSRDRFRAAVAAFRRPPATPPTAPARPATAAIPEEGWKEFEAARNAARTAQGEKARDLERLGASVTSQIALLEAERANLDRARKAHDEAAARARKDREELAAVKTDAELTANLPILSKMDGPAVLSLMKGWEDARIVRYLRAMKPAKVLEVLEALKTDPQFEQDFRQPPAGAPKGAVTRADRLVDEFMKRP